MATNGNNHFIRAIFWTLILGSFAWTTAVLYCSTASDDVITDNVQCVEKDIIRIDTNQKAVMLKLEEVVKTQNAMVTSQAVIVDNQGDIINTLNEIKRRIQ